MNIKEKYWRRIFTLDSNLRLVMVHLSSDLHHQLEIDKTIGLVNRIFIDSIKSIDDISSLSCIEIIIS